MKSAAIRIPLISRWTEALAVAFLLLLGMSGVFPGIRPHGAFAFAILFFLLWKKEFLLFSSILLLTLWHWIPTIFQDFAFASAFHFLLPLFFTLPFLLLVPKSNQYFAFWRKGEIDSVSIFLSIILVVLSVLFLLLWATYSNNLGAGMGLVRDLKDIPKIYLYLLVPFFAFAVSLVEEVSYRGILQGCLMGIFPGAWYAASAISAFLFASAHFVNGFPNGLWGLASTFIYGFFLGYLRWRTGGIYLSLLTHFIGDLVIGFILVFLSR